MANLFANRIFIGKNKRYSFEDRPAMITIVDDPHRFKLLVTGRQVSKSTYLAGSQIVKSEAYAPYKSLYLSPTYKQTSVFSHDRLAPTISQSPAIVSMIDKSCLSNVLEKEFTNGSKINLLYAKDNADRARGQSVDGIDFDEIQDMHISKIEPVVSESMFASPHKHKTYSGTPKSFSNAINAKWNESDKREWMVRCHHHGPHPYHQPLTIKNVGLAGPICDKCGKPLDVLDGVWVITTTKTSAGADPYIHGYRIPQIMIPTNKVKLPSGAMGILDWDDFLLSIKNTDEATVQNEKFGYSADSAEKPITEEMLRRICNEFRSMPVEYCDWMIGEYTFAGVDWGAGLGSATALVIGQFNPKHKDVFNHIYYRKFDGKKANPEYCVPEILADCRKFRVKRFHADWGSGLGINSKIYDQMGEEFITTNYWSSSISSKTINYHEDLNRFTLNRTYTMAKFIEAKSSRKIRTAFRWDEYKPFAIDLMNVYMEKRKNGDRFYDHEAGTQDDFFHAEIYCWLIACWMRYSEAMLEKRSDGRFSVANPM